MSALMIGNIRGFIDISSRLEDIGITTIHFYYPNNGIFNTPMTVLPFIDLLILGKEAFLTPHVNEVIDEAFSRHIPVLSEDCITRMDINLTAIKKALRLV